MIKKLPEYIEMFEGEKKPLEITIQIKEHFVRLYTDETGFDILFESLRDIPFELLRYSSVYENIELSLKYYEEVV